MKNKEIKSRKCVSKNFNQTVHLQFKISGERLQRIAKGSSSAPHLASSSVASFPSRNQCRGTHSSLIEQEKKKVPTRSDTEFEIGKNLEEGTGWRGQNESQIIGEETRNGRLVGAADTSKEHSEW